LFITVGIRQHCLELGNNCAEEYIVTAIPTPAVLTQDSPNQNCINYIVVTDRRSVRIAGVRIASVGIAG
jgi:hypothetical protein